MKKKYSMRSGQLHTLIHSLNYSDYKLQPNCTARERKEKQVLRVPQFTFFFPVFKQLMFGGAEFSQLLLVCKASKFSFISE